MTMETLDLVQQTASDGNSASAATTCESDQIWEALVHATDSQDVYYRPGYVRTYEATGAGQGRALVITARGSRFLLPLLVRPLSGLKFASHMTGYDAMTPYGYGALLQLSGPVENSRETVEAFCGALRQWCNENEIVSVLFRLHPLLEQADWFGAVPECFRLSFYGATVGLDLNAWNEDKDRLPDLSRGRRADLNHAHRNLRITWASEFPGSLPEYLEHFRRIYEGRMSELEADRSYFFPPEYYTSLASGLGDGLDIALTWCGDKLAGGSLYMAGRTFAHAHLTGDNELGRTHRAGTLLINEGARWAKRRGCRWLHIGGGKNGEDALFEYKKTFGGSLFKYHFAGFVADPQRYAELVALRNSQEELPRENYFPEYRA